MKRKSASQSAFFNSRVLISLAFCAIGLFLALLVFALYPGGKAFARQNQSDSQGLAPQNIPMLKSASGTLGSLNTALPDTLPVSNAGTFSQDGTCPPTITESSSQAITAGNSVSCNNGTGHTDNSYWRAFNMATFTGGQQYNVTSVSFGCEMVNVTQPVTVRLYTTTNFPAGFPGSLTQIATTTLNVGPGDTGMVHQTPLMATVPAGASQLVMELFTPDGTTSGNLFFVGSNTAAETAPSYISATACGITVPTTTAAVGFPNMHIVFNVNGSCSPGGTPSTTPSASATPSCPPPSWSAGPNLPAAGGVRAVGIFFPANGRFYTMGGRSSDTAGNDFTHPFEYNPTTNAWTTKGATYPDVNVNNMACGVITVGGTPQIYCVGGSAGGGTTATARVFSYNPVTDVITTLTAADNWPGNATGTILPGGFAVVSNKLYIIGGFQITTNMTSQTWQFDPTAAAGARWLQRLDYPVARGYVPAANVGGIIYTGGGSTTDGTTLSDTTDSFKYDPVANTWTAIANIPRATAETRGVVINNEMWVLGGGRTAPNPSNEVDIYNPGSNMWRTGLPFVTARRNFPADSDGTSRVFLAGGYDSTGTALLNTMEIFSAGACGTPSPTPTATATATGTPASPTPTATATATVAATATATATVPPSPSPSPSMNPGPGQALNLSTRMLVQTGAEVGIGGFIVTGTAPKRVLLRAIGPSLPVSGALADPVMELHGPAGFTTIINDNWMDDPVQKALIIATGIPPTNNLESAIVETLAPGPYTAIVSGKNGTSGVALVEVYDLAQAAASKLGNISTRAFVSTGANIMIAGFILGNGTMNDNVILRGIGPSLPVTNKLADPTLELRDSNGTLIRADDNWQDDPVQAGLITAAGLAPTNPLESGIYATLAPGPYTALLAGKNNGTGVGLVEVYDLLSGGGGGGTPTPTATAGGTSPTPTATATPGGGGTCMENWDGVTAPALPAGWTATNPDPGDGTMWVTTTVSSETAPNNAFVADQDGISDKVLDRAGVAISSTSPMMSFRNNFNTEMSGGIFWDGYVLEVSAPNISGGDFLDFTDPHVGGSCATGCYTGLIDGTANNPLAGRMAWSGNSGGYIDTMLNLGPNLAGQTVTLRFRMGSDEAVAAPGAHIDNISITGASCP